MHETPEPIARLPLSVSYDLHYAFSEQHLLQAEPLLTKVRVLLRRCITAMAEISHAQLFDCPGGPWPTPMWFLKVSLLSAQNPDIAAITDFREKIIECALQVQSMLIEENARGAFFVHANTYPENVNMIEERGLHFDKAWHVYGPPVHLKDIWSGPSGLIELQAFVQEAYAKDCSEESICQALLAQFAPMERFDRQALQRYCTILLKALKESERSD